MGMQGRQLDSAAAAAADAGIGMSHGVGFYYFGLVPDGLAIFTIFLLVVAGWRCCPPGGRVLPRP